MSHLLFAYMTPLLTNSVFFYLQTGTSKRQKNNKGNGDEGEIITAEANWFSFFEKTTFEFRREWVQIKEFTKNIYKNETCCCKFSDNSVADEP